MIIKKCRFCGKEFRARHNGRVLCGNACKVAERVDSKAFKCEECGGEFWRPRHRWNEARFCSTSCTARFTFREHPPGHSHKKGNTFAAGHSPANKGKPSPFRGHRLVEYVSEVCSNCGITIERPPHIANIKTGKSAFCSVLCRGEYRRNYESGINSPFWVGGPTTYRGKGWIAARIKAVERDAGTCRDCGIVIGDSIPVHHITPYRLFDSPEQANRLENLECLCQSCHMKKEPRKTCIPVQAF